MELGYRLAVDEAPYIRQIRAGVITLITPVVEVDGRDRKVDVYNWHLANPGKTYPSLAYWGHYVARSEEHTSELQSLMRISYAVFCLKKQQNTTHTQHPKINRASSKHKHDTHITTTH